MSIEVIVYLASMAAVYFFANFKRSIAFLWIVVYFLIAWPIEDYYQGNLSIAYVLTAGVLIALCEFLTRQGKDPFAYDSVRLRVINTIKLVWPSPKTTVMKTSGYKSIERANKYIKQKKWQKLEQYIKQLSDDDRHTVYQGLAEEGIRPSFIDEWLKARPKSGVAYRASGFSHIRVGWEARSAATADEVSLQGWEEFSAELDAAEEDFQKAIKLKDDCYTPYLGLITIAMGSGVGSENMWKYFAKGTSMSPHNYPLHSSMIHACAPKWGGEASDMFTVANTARKEANNNHPVSACLAIAHVEHWLSLSMMGDEEEAEEYFQQNSVREELLGLVEEMKSYGNFDFSSLEAKNVIVFCLEKAEMYKEFRKMVPFLKGKYTEYPWIYYEGSFLAGVDTAYALDHVLKKHGF